MDIFSQSTSSNYPLFDLPLKREPLTPNIHAYHRYQSLLRYITSYLFDVKMILTDLKMLAYQLVGIEHGFLNSSRSPSNGNNRVTKSQKKSKHNHFINQQLANRMSSRIYNDKYCEIEFMMKNCHTTKEDLLRITNLIRGYKIGSDHQNICEQCQQIVSPAVQVRKNQQSESSFLDRGNNRNRPYSHDSVSEGRPYETISSRKSELDFDEIGFLTFREMSDDLKPAFNVTEKISQVPNQIQEYHRNQGRNKQRKYSGTAKSQQKNSDLWIDSLNLISLMRQQLNKESNPNNKGI